MSICWENRSKSARVLRPCSTRNKGFTLTMSMEYVEQAQGKTTATCSVQSRCFPRTLPCSGKNYLLTMMAVMDSLRVEEGAAGHHDGSRCNEQFKAGWRVRKKGTRAIVLCWPLEWWTVWGWGGCYFVRFILVSEGGWEMASMNEG